MNAFVYSLIGGFTGKLISDSSGFESLFLAILMISFSNGDFPNSSS